MVNCGKQWKSLSVLLLGGALVMGGVLGSETARAQGKGKTQTLTGTISDSMCGAKHKMADGKQCMLGCIKSMGGKQALVVGDKVYALEGKTAEIEKLANEKVTVTGTVDGMTVKVSSVAKAS